MVLMSEMPVCIWLAMQKDANPFMKFTCMEKNLMHYKIVSRVKNFTCTTKMFHTCEERFTCTEEIHIHNRIISHVCKKIHMHGKIVSHE